MNFPFGANSNSCAAVAPYAGPLVLPRENTKMWFFESTAIPVTSPKFISGGSFSGFGTESNPISGTASCAFTAAGAKTTVVQATTSTAPIRRADFANDIVSSRGVQWGAISVGELAGSLV